MAKLYKILEPKVGSNLEGSLSLRDGLEYEKEVKDSKFTDDILDYINEDSVSIYRCYFKDVIFNECKLRNVDMLDVVFDNCDLSNADFIEGSIHRTEFRNCKLVGANFGESTLQNVSFKQCKMRYSNFAYSKSNKVNFDNCELNYSAFLETKFNKTAFSECNLERTEFLNTLLKDIDFTDSNIEQMILSGKELRGAIVSADQAMELALLLGIIIK